MKAYEIYQNIDSTLVVEMCQWLRSNEKDLYNNALGSLAANRKLRPIFVQKKKPADQAAWLHKTLKLRTSDTIGEHLFQVWFMKGQQEILKAFCDGMDIKHDGEGQVEGELPETLDADKLKSTVDTLVGANDPKMITLYLSIFNLQTPAGWDTLSEILKSDERLVLN
ncbi:hypothetical protein N9F50_01170 [Akkermansiaceae bacterium]|nr:hypothetical protein [Akkermansiaceae bacterium]MDB4419057.1 hypothetical protein [bacterium]MDB4436084.1 hypothetical protein [Akkermansiaceae bacterium]